MRISIIVPVFNAENQLPKCIDSILAQSLSNFELLLIDDGSTDGSLEICEKYAEREKRIRVFHQENAGPSAARNKGIEHASGKYLTFIDADDFVEPNYLQGFFKLEKDPEAAVVIQGYIRESRNGLFRKENLPEEIFQTHQFSNLFLSVFLIRKWPFVWAKLFDKNIIDKHKVLFDKEINFGEDLIFFLNYVKFASKIITINENLYHYKFLPNSLTSSLNEVCSETKRLDTVKSLLTELAVQFDFSAALQEYHRSYMNRYLMRVLDSLYLPPSRKQKQERISWLKKLDTEKNLELIRYIENPGKRVKIMRQLSDNKQFVFLDLFLNQWYKYRYRRKFKYQK